MVRYLTLASLGLNDQFGSTSALRGCHAIEHFRDANEGQPSAKWSFTVAAWRLESRHSDYAPHTVGLDRKHASLGATPNNEMQACMIYLDEVLQAEHIGLCECVQRGLNSFGSVQFSKSVSQALTADKTLRRAIAALPKRCRRICTVAEAIQRAPRQPRPRQQHGP